MTWLPDAGFWILDTGKEKDDVGVEPFGYFGIG
jgi:hypothetical protein